MKKIWFRQLPKSVEKYHSKSYFFTWGQTLTLMEGNDTHSPTSPTKQIQSLHSISVFYSITHNVLFLIPRISVIKIHPNEKSEKSRMEVRWRRIQEYRLAQKKETNKQTRMSFLVIANCKWRMWRLSIIGIGTFQSWCNKSRKIFSKTSNKSKNINEQWKLFLH